jgi:hypothetical protein
MALVLDARELNDTILTKIESENPILVQSVLFLLPRVARWYIFLLKIPM